MATFTNQIKTVVLLGVLSAIMLWIGYAFGGSAGLYIGLAFALLTNGLSYFFSDKLVLWMSGAKPADGKEHKDLISIVHEVSNLANLPMPKVYIIQDRAANAFATGRNPKHAAVACTLGVLEILTREELKGVIAHEVAHIKNRDILIQTIAATIASVIGFIATMARWGAMFGWGKNDRDGGSIIELLVLAILIPLIATLLQLALSRAREYVADETGATIIHNPLALASALEKLGKYTAHQPFGKAVKETEGMFIVAPFRGNALLNLLSTHPPMEERVKRLRAMS
ncbi:zinc metalloprotease HtpX [Candidatus Woesearchaeota archaeon]|nr:zinc metalloprotease HtpX [Candidatus Woesearchaeota archaeon]